MVCHHEGERKEHAQKKRHLRGEKAKSFCNFFSTGSCHYFVNIVYFLTRRCCYLSTTVKVVARIDKQFPGAGIEDANLCVYLHS